MISPRSETSLMNNQKKTISALRGGLPSSLCLVALLMLASSLAAQSVHVAFDSAAKVFRLDGANTSYVFGVNPRGELQPVYWGGRLGEHHAISQPQPMREAASSDSSHTTTPQEYAGWGAGLFVEPALKVTLADGNRDLV